MKWFNAKQMPVIVISFIVGIVLTILVGFFIPNVDIDTGKQEPQLTESEALGLFQPYYRSSEYDERIKIYFH